MLQLERGYLFEGKYKIQRELGKGGFGMVYQARQLGMERDVAIKILNTEIGGEAAATARERFLREVRIISKLRHPNTVTIHDFGQTQQGLVYMVLEYVAGDTLKEMVVRRGALEEVRMVKIAHQIAKSLSEAHRHGIIHRDLKPQNIMLTELGGETDFVKVLDFGIARFRNRDDGKDLTNTGNPNERELIGTPRYMSPEQVRGEEITGASDVYSLGLMCYEMLAGEPAVQGDTMMALITQQVSPEPLRLPHLYSFHPLVQQIVLKATNKQVAHRYRTVDIFSDELEHAMLELRRERVASSTSSDILLGNQYDPTPSSRQTGPQSALPFQSHHYSQQGTPQQSRVTGQMNDLLLSNAPPPVSEQQRGPRSFGHADEEAETNLQLEPLSAATLSQGPFALGNTTPPARPQPVSPPTSPTMAALPHHASQQAPQQQPHFAPQQPVAPPFSPQDAAFPLDLPPPTSDTRQPLIDNSRVFQNKMPPVSPDEEEADLSYVIDLLVTGVLTVVLLGAIYTAFLLIGAVMGVLIEGLPRLIITLVVSALLLMLPILSETGRRERFQVIYSTLHRVRRVVMLSLGAHIGTMILISLTLPAKIVTRLEHQPNWFADTPTVQSGFLRLNADYSDELAKLLRKTTATIDEEEIDALQTPDTTPMQPRDKDLPLRIKTTPQPTRNQNKSDRGAGQKEERPTKSDTSSAPKGGDSKSGTYQKW